MKPVILINFKTYEEATAENAIRLARICERVAKDTDSDIRIAVQATDIFQVVHAVKIPVYAQHVDPVSYGKYTGFITPEAVKQAGATGTLLNHSEHRLRVDDLESSVKRAKALGLTIVLCANDPLMGQALAALEPDFIAIEPPELIGGEVSVSSAEPEIITEAVKRICGKKHCFKVLVGAGVHTDADIKKAVKLGAVGVLLASGIATAKDPEKALRSLVS